MKVLLKRPLFIGSVLYHRSIPKDNPVEIPEEYRDMLPESAVVVDDYKADKTKEKKPTLHEADNERAAGEAEGNVWKELNKVDAGSAMVERAEQLEAADKKKQSRSRKKEK